MGKGLGGNLPPILTKDEEISGGEDEDELEDHQVITKIGGIN